MRGENLDGDSAIEASVARTVDFAHAARAERVLDFDTGQVEYLD